MFYKCYYSLLLSITVCTGAHAQSKKQASLKLDALNFRNQVVKLKEYKSEQRKTASLAKIYGGPVSIAIEIDVDTTTEDDEVMDAADNIITGYVKEQTPTESIVAYQLHFDRTTKKIIDIKSEADAADTKPGKDDDK